MFLHAPSSHSRSHHAACGPCLAAPRRRTVGGTRDPGHRLPPLLRLTPLIRHRIYRYLGVAPWSTSHRCQYGFDLHGRRSWVTDPRPSWFHGLLLSCRVIYTEASELLYSANRFMIIYAHADPEPLKPLLALTASSLASLTSLKIILNQVSCHRHEQYGADPLCCLDGREANWSGVYHCHSHYDTHLLPRELRLRILEYTDLIVPSRDVAWSRQDQGYLTFHSESEFAHDYEYRRQFFGCWFPSNTQTPQGPRPYTGCFCRRRHSAFSSFTCKCWAPPGPALFLVCRTLYQDAVLTFYSGNRFIVYDYRADPPWGLPLMDENPRGPVPVYDYPNERLAASQFLREVVPAHCLGHLRFLELVFPPYRPRSWPRLESAATQDWRATVDWLQDKINAPGLTLRVVGGDVSDWTPDSYSDPITVSEGHTIKEAYMNRLRPLRQLGLTRFYAHLPDPWQRREPQNEDISQELIEDGKRRMKSMAERFVMGDQYESLYANNKEEPGLSLWELFHYHDT